MTMNFDALRERLDKLSRAGSSDDAALFFKATEEPTQIRIIAYPHAENPFLEVYYHYNVGGERSIVCPYHAGEGDCPICALAKDFWNQNTPESKKFYSDFKAKMRVYAPVIIRGREDEGVKLWGFSKTAYQDLATFALDPDYGDFSDPVNGRDITIKLVKPGQAGNDTTFPITKIRMKPNTSKMLEGKTKAQMQEFLDEVPNYLEMDMFKPKEYKDLLNIVTRYTQTAEAESDVTVDEAPVPAEVKVSKKSKPTSISTAKLDSLLDDDDDADGQ